MRLQDVPRQKRVASDLGAFLLFWKDAFDIDCQLRVLSAYTELEQSSLILQGVNQTVISRVF